MEHPRLGSQGATLRRLHPFPHRRSGTTRLRRHFRKVINFGKPTRRRPLRNGHHLPIPRTKLLKAALRTTAYRNPQRHYRAKTLRRKSRRRLQIIRPRALEELRGVAHLLCRSSFLLKPSWTYRNRSCPSPALRFHCRNCLFQDRAKRLPQW